MTNTAAPLSHVEVVVGGVLCVQGGCTSIIPYKMAPALDPLLQEIKFQNGLWLRQQNKGA